MKLEERVAEATNDKKLKNDLIGEKKCYDK